MAVLLLGVVATIFPALSKLQDSKPSHFPSVHFRLKYRKEPVIPATFEFYALNCTEDEFEYLMESLPPIYRGTPCEDLSRAAIAIQQEKFEDARELIRPHVVRERSGHRSIRHFDRVFAELALSTQRRHSEALMDLGFMAGTSEADSKKFLENVLADMYLESNFDSQLTRKLVARRLMELVPDRIEARRTYIEAFPESVTVLTSFVTESGEVAATFYPNDPTISVQETPKPTGPLLSVEVLAGITDGVHFTAGRLTRARQ